MKDITENPAMTIQSWNRGERIDLRKHPHVVELMPVEVHIKADGAKGNDMKAEYSDSDTPSVAFICSSPDILALDPTAPVVVVQISARMLAPIIRELQRLESGQ